MENASKALIMAGSILLAIMVIGLLVFGYRQMSDLEQTKENSKEVDKLAEYMARFEQFNRGKDNPLYGSELLSLANLQEDYNLSDARADVGYDKIEIYVNITKKLEGYLEAGQEYNISEILEKINGVLEEIDKYENTKNNQCILYNGKTVKYYSKKSYREIALDFMDKIEKALKEEVEKEFGDDVKFTGIPSSWGNDRISDFLLSQPETSSLMIDIDTYDNLKNTVYNQFRTGKRFYCESVDYNKYNGRIKTMTFVEI